MKLKEAWGTVDLSLEGLKLFYPDDVYCHRDVHWNLKEMNEENTYSLLVMDDNGVVLLNELFKGLLDNEGGFYGVSAGFTVKLERSSYVRGVSIRLTTAEDQTINLVFGSHTGQGTVAWSTLERVGSFVKGALLGALYGASIGLSLAFWVAIYFIATQQAIVGAVLLGIIGICAAAGAVCLGAYNTITMP